MFILRDLRDMSTLRDVSTLKDSCVEIPLETQIVEWFVVPRIVSRHTTVCACMQVSEHVE